MADNATVPSSVRWRGRVNKVLNLGKRLTLKPYSLAEHLITVKAGTRDPLVPPRHLHHIGLGDFATGGREFLHYFRDQFGLRPHERVLDVGCGTGRMAFALTRHLEPPGSYDGLDIVPASIRWCQKTYAPRHPHFRFHHADVWNDHYNPGGTCPAAEYRFPFADAAFDFVFLTSVFTHMLAADMENYLGEIARVLRPGGRSVITYFLLNAESERLIAEGRSAHTFRVEQPGCRSDVPGHPAAAVAFPDDAVRGLHARLGLKLWEPLRYGRWCGRPEGLSWQDVVVSTKE